MGNPFDNLYMCDFTTALWHPATKRLSIYKVPMLFLGERCSLMKEAEINIDILDAFFNSVFSLDVRYNKGKQEETRIR